MSNDENTLVAGSSPAIRTIIPKENEVSGVPDTVLTQETPESTDTEVKFPKRIKHRGRVFATIYGRSKSYPSYRVAWAVTGRRMMKAFLRYGEAKRHADGQGPGQRFASHRPDCWPSARCPGRA